MTTTLVEPPPVNRSRRLQRQLRLVLYAADCQFDHAQRAGALTYRLLLTIVPGLVLVFSFAAIGSSSSPGIGELVLQYIPQPEVKSWLEPFTKSDRTKLGLLSFLGLLVTVYFTLDSIAETLNQRWSVVRRHTLARRLVLYWSLLTVTPLLLGFSLALTVQAQQGAAGWFSNHVSPSLLSLLETVAVRPLVSAMTTCLAFTALYCILPCAQVPVAAAFHGAAFAAVLFEITKGVYAWFTSWSVSASNLYGSLAALVLFAVWVNLSWRCVLFGADMAYAVQQGSTALERPPSGATARRELVAARLCAVIAKAFMRGDSPPSAGALSRYLALDIQEVEDLATRLRKAGFLREVSESMGLLPSRSPERLSVADALDAVRNLASEVPSELREDHLAVPQLDAWEAELLTRLREKRWSELASDMPSASLGSTELPTVSSSPAASCSNGPLHRPCGAASGPCS